MALHDLTPQLRTRLSRMERAVGWFVILATALLLFGFGYYIYNMAQRKGWFITKIDYQTSISTGAGLKVGDPVKLMGFDVGEITRIQANDPYDYYNITVDFWIKAPYYGYLWSDSTVRVAAADLLGNRYLEVMKGIRGVPTIAETNNEAIGMLRRDVLQQKLDALLNDGLDITNAYKVLNQQAQENRSAFYTHLTKESVYWLDPVESPAVTERLERLVAAAEEALPNILALTNQLAAVLANSARLTDNLSQIAADARPAVSNLAIATAQLDRPGGLGEWLLPTNINARLDSVLGGADATLNTANTNLAVLAQNLNQSLENLASMTSNLNAQVQANTNILSQISKTIVDADNLVQGLKRHWLLRSAFRGERRERSQEAPAERLRSPKAEGAR